MDTREAIARRIWELCRQRRITPNGLATASAVPQATIKSILNGESRNPGTVTIKKLCDGFEITLGEFFSTPEFDALEQEIKWVCRGRCRSQPLQREMNRRLLHGKQTPVALTDIPRRNC